MRARDTTMCPARHCAQHCTKLDSRRDGIGKAEAPARFRCRSPANAPTISSPVAVIARQPLKSRRCTERQSSVTCKPHPAIELESAGADDALPTPAASTADGDEPESALSTGMIRYALVSSDSVRRLPCTSGEATE